MSSYDASQMGVPFVRVNDLRISYAPDMTALVQFHEQEAVVLADGSVRVLGDVGWRSFSLSAASTTTVPLVDPVTSQALGAQTTPQQVMLGILAIVRAQQVREVEIKPDEAPAAA